MQSDGFVSRGIECLDRLLGELLPGDNVVWEVGFSAPVDVFVRSSARAALNDGQLVVFVSFGQPPRVLLRGLAAGLRQDGLVVLDCTWSGPAKPEDREADITSGWQAAGGAARIIAVPNAGEPGAVTGAVQAIEEEFGDGALYIFDSVTAAAELWGDEEAALSFFLRTCARLHDRRRLAHWLLEREAHSEQFLTTIRQATQVVIDLDMLNSSPVLVVRKAEGRRSWKLGIPQRLVITGETIAFAPESREEMEVAVLSEVSEAIGGALDLERVCEKTMEILARELKMKRGTLVLLDKLTGGLRIAAAHGLSEEEKARGRYKIGEGVTGQVVSTGQPVAVADISRDPRFLNRTGARLREKERAKISFVCVPLQVDSERVGAISVDREFADERTLAKDQRLLQIIASLVSQAIKINRMVMVEREELLAENLRLRKDLGSRYKLGNIVAASGTMQDVVATAAAVAKSDATVLVRGETGTGKELIASVLHYNSSRAKGPFIKVNCGALSEGLLESELFGHVRGAFTGAVADRQGRFELADGGSIFLDEVGSMSEKLQVRLLRVLQEREFERVGGMKTIKVDVRIVAASNQDLERLMDERTFREDLYYRLNVIPIFIPPLRERREDIPFLVDHFLAKYAREYGKDVTRLSRQVLDALIEYNWPGNVRELESCIERAVVLSRSGAVTLDLLPVSVRSYMEKERGPRPVGAPEQVVEALVSEMRRTIEAGPGALHERVMSRIEKALIEQVLRDNDSVQTRTARELGLSRNTVRRKIADYGISAEPVPDGS